MGCYMEVPGGICNGDTTRALLLCSWKQTRNKQHRNKVGWGDSAVTSWGKKVVDAALGRVEMPQSVSTPPVSFSSSLPPKALYRPPRTSLSLISFTLIRSFCSYCVRS